MTWDAVLIEGVYQKMFLQLLVTTATYQTFNTGNDGSKKMLFSTIFLVLFSSLAINFSDSFSICADWTT